MSILKDEKVVAAMEKEAAKAVKAETKRVLEVLKTAKASAKDIEDKAAKKLVADVLKQVEAEIKAA